MDLPRELQKVKQEMETRHIELTSQLRAEFSRFSGNTQMTLRTIDDRIAEKVREEVRLAFADIKILIGNLKLRQGVSQ